MSNLSENQAEELYALIVLKNLGTLSFDDLDARILNTSLVLESLIRKGFIKQRNDEYTITKSGLHKIKEDQAEAKEDQAEDVKKIAIIQKGEAVFSVAFTLQAAIQDVNDYFGNEIDDYNENSIDHFRNVNEGDLCWVHISDRLINEINKGKVDLFEYDYKNEVLDVADFEEIQAEDQAENQAKDQAKDQAEAKPKALKESTVKRYDVHQLTRHLEKLQDHFLIAPFRIDTIIREYDSYTNSYLVYCQIHEINRDMIIDAIESTYRKLKIDWSWPNLQQGRF